jgi:hypothetical protein
MISSEKRLDCSVWQHIVLNAVLPRGHLEIRIRNLIHLLVIIIIIIIIKVRARALLDFNSEESCTAIGVTRCEGEQNRNFAWGPLVSALVPSFKLPSGSCSYFLFCVSLT